jgi:hypothetical protein
MKEIVIMRFILSFLMLLASMLASIGAVNYPARTNGNNTFFGTNRHVGPVIVGNTNQIASEGSVINNAFFTNGTITLKLPTSSIQSPLYILSTATDAAFYGIGLHTVYLTDSLGNFNVSLLLSNVTSSGKISAYGVIIKSNTIASIPTLTFGDNFYWSSNGVPHVIWKDQAGTQVTNRLVP